MSVHSFHVLWIFALTEHTSFIPSSPGALKQISVCHLHLTAGAKRATERLSDFCLSTRYKSLGRWPSDSLSLSLPPRSLEFQAHLHDVYLPSKEHLRFYIISFPGKIIHFYMFTITFICYNEGRKCKNMVVLRTRLSFRDLTLVKFSIVSSYGYPEVRMVTTISHHCLWSSVQWID